MTIGKASERKTTKYSEHNFPFCSKLSNNFTTHARNSPEKWHFCEINQKETLAQIFTDIRYTRKDNEAMSEGLLQALKHQGFIA